MKTFFYMGPNAKVKSRVSWKVWKIERRGRKVLVAWGPVRLVNRTALPKGELQRKEKSFRSFDRAKEYESLRIRSKLAKGYKKTLRRS